MYSTLAKKPNHKGIEKRQNVAVIGPSSKLSLPELEVVVESEVDELLSVLSSFKCFSFCVLSRIVKLAFNNSRSTKQTLYESKCLN